MERSQILDWAVELQSLAQAGLFYGKDVYDIERFTRIRAIAAEMVSQISDVSLEKVTELFCCETGYQTPKLDTRAAIFQGDKILLVQETNGLWSLPGGWADVNLSIGENAVKEVREEAGLEVTIDRVIALQDRNKHNQPPYAFGICKVFFLCTVWVASLSPISKLRPAATSLWTISRPCAGTNVRRSRSACASRPRTTPIGRRWLSKQNSSIKFVNSYTPTSIFPASGTFGSELKGDTSWNASFLPRI